LKGSKRGQKNRSMEEREKNKDHADFGMGREKETNFTV